MPNVAFQNHFSWRVSSFTYLSFSLYAHFSRQMLVHGCIEHQSSLEEVSGRGRFYYPHKYYGPPASILASPASNCCHSNRHYGHCHDVDNDDNNVDNDDNDHAGCHTDDDSGPGGGHYYGPAHKLTDMLLWDGPIGTTA